MSEEVPGTWRQLRQYWAVMTVLAGGVLVGAVSIYLAASLLPTAVRDIGGDQLYAWNMTVYLVGQVVAAMLAANVLRRAGAQGAYVTGFGLFAAGSVICTVAPTMPIMLIGRGLQGLGAGLLTGLGFALIQATLPAALWSRGSAVISAMFGLGNFVGPALGGTLAQAGAWRWAFGALTVLAITLGALAARVLRTIQLPAGGAAPRIPRWALVLVVAAVASLSVASLTDSAPLIVALVITAAIMAVGFVVVESRSSTRVLPASTYRRGSAMRWIYLTIAVLASSVAVETFLPLFGQQLGDLPPVAAGFYGAALSLGWALTQVWSASAHGRRANALMLGGPAVLVIGLAVLAVTIAADASIGLVVGWLVVLVLAGSGIGMAMPHLTVRAMSSAEDQAEAQQAAASIATVLTMGTASGAAVAGLLVNLGQPNLETSARYLLAGFALIAVVGIATAKRLTARRYEPVAVDSMA
ncbi:MFS transporter [Kribbella solani]|uniref:MFS transporter n=1 Tax=Kribbella solani TaxID=236067 RepID=UPI0029A36940|nr:MFS transporter [Kribbella solani]MDX2971967.1 MFS transporter [Kribbella solani]